MFFFLFVSFLDNFQRENYLLALIAKMKGKDWHEKIKITEDKKMSYIGL